MPSVRASPGSVEFEDGESGVVKSSTTLILIVAAVVAMVLGGWVTFSDSGDSASMTLHKEKVKQDTEAAVEKGEEFLKDTTDKGKQLINQAGHSD